MQESHWGVRWGVVGLFVRESSWLRLRLRGQMGVVAQPRQVRAS